MATPTATPATKTPQAILDEIRNALPHLLKDNQDPSAQRVFWGLGVIDEALRQFSDLQRVITRAVEATTYAALQTHPASWEVAPAPAAVPHLIHADQPDSPENRYLDEATAKAITTALDSPHVLSEERNKMLLNLPKLSQARGEQSLAKLQKAIDDRQAALDAAANQDLATAHEIPPVQKTLSPQEIRDQKQAEQYGGAAEADQFDAQQGTPAKPKTRAKKPKEAVEPAGDLTLENLLKPTGNEGQPIDPAQAQTGGNLYASLAQKTKLLQTAQNVKITNGEKSTLYLGINRLSYADAEKAQAQLSALIRERPEPKPLGATLPPAGDPVKATAAVEPSDLPFLRD